MLIGKAINEPALFITSFEGYGDLVYHTPTIRVLSKYFKNLDVYCKRREPFLHNPCIRQLHVFEGITINPPNIYEGRVFFVSVDSLIQFPHCKIHTVDLVSIKALRTVFRSSEKTLEAYWTPSDMQRVRDLLSLYKIEGEFVVVSPSITWPSRTLPLRFYQELISGILKRGCKVILVGKDVAYSTGVDCDKKLYPAYHFPGAISLYNQLTFSELAALYSLTPIAINTENGNNPISCTNDFCWNLYIPTLTAPEYRLPFRHGTQSYKTAIAANSEDYYPASVYGDTGATRYDTMPINMPTVPHVLNVFQTVLARIREGKHFI